MDDLQPRAERRGVIGQRAKTDPIDAASSRISPRPPTSRRALCRMRQRGIGIRRISREVGLGVDWLRLMEAGGACYGG